jgi:hypothetical protein
MFALLSLPLKVLFVCNCQDVCHIPPPRPGLRWGFFVLNSLSFALQERARG